MNFSIEKKGYSISEVDSYIGELNEKCRRLQAQNTELEQKLATAKRLIRRFSDTENALKQNIADSKRAAAYMLSDARDRSEELLDSARESCGEIISDLDMQISERINTIDNMKAEVLAFKDEIFALYSSHIELMDKIAYVAESFEYCPDYSAVADAVDKFEGESQLPEFETGFVDYPEESIFAELDEQKPAEVSVEPEASFEATDGESVTEAEDEEPEAIEAFEEADAEELSLSFDDADGEPEVEIEIELEDDEEAFDDIVIDKEAFDAAVEIDFDSLVIDGEDAPAEDEAEPLDSDIDKEDYLKFLRDFANSDDSEEN